MNEENISLSLGQNGIPDLDTFYEMVKERAFFKAEKRGFEPGHEMDDWLEAEKEIRNQCHYWSQEVN
ncbi:DUF2934 domain-containing protein [Methylosarcina fibrata]|uniref:DUF2934 domain-containing protein n=1 Tax=Methylosarcina fibrata TaxID=105972 RepID=UPI00035F8A9F|nr:DUF2934 domain-containing protein [Methylosarcina fibrata]